MLDQPSVGSPAFDKPVIGFKSVVDRDILSASSGSSTQSVRNVWSPDTFTRHEFIGVASDFLVLTGAGVNTVDYIAIVGHNFKDASVTFWLECDQPGLSDVNIFTVTSSQVLDYDCIFVAFAAVTGSNFVLRMTYSSIKPYISHVKMGVRTVLQDRSWSDNSPLVYSRDVDTVNQVSLVGNFLGRINKSVSKSCKISQENNTEGFVVSELSEFIQHCDGTSKLVNMSPHTFFYIPNPHRSVVGIPTNKGIVYGWAKNQIMPVQHVNNMYSWTLDVEAVA